MFLYIVECRRWCILTSVLAFDSLNCLLSEHIEHIFWMSTGWTCFLCSFMSFIKKFKKKLKQNNILDKFASGDVIEKLFSFFFPKKRRSTCETKAWDHLIPTNRVPYRLPSPWAPCIYSTYQYKHITVPPHISNDFTKHQICPSFSSTTSTHCQSKLNKPGNKKCFKICYSCYFSKEYFVT